MQILVQAGRLEIPVDDQDALAVARKNPRGIGERHRPARATLVRVERDDRAALVLRRAAHCEAGPDVGDTVAREGPFSFTRAARMSVALSARCASSCLIASSKSLADRIR